MSWHIHSNTSVFDSDAYGIDTDIPESAYEQIDNMLKVKDEEKIADAIREFKEALADEYFYTSNWTDEHWEAWNEKFLELT